MNESMTSIKAIEYLIYNQI